MPNTLVTHGHASGAAVVAAIVGIGSLLALSSSQEDGGRASYTALGCECNAAKLARHVRYETYLRGSVVSLRVYFLPTTAGG